MAPTDHGALGPVNDGDGLHLEGRSIEGREFPFGANVVQTTTWVALSPTCRALLNGGFLAGLVVAL